MDPFVKQQTRTEQKVMQQLKSRIILAVGAAAFLRIGKWNAMSDGEKCGKNRNVDKM